jgi:peptidoglycan/LPS O-acetylase OafA/YrhL
MTDRPGFVALKSVHDALQPTPLFRAGTWLLLCAVVCGFGWRWRETTAGAFALGVCGSAVVYLASFLAVGVASDFRYAYWAVLAGLAGAVIMPWRAPRPPPRPHAPSTSRQDRA